MTYRTPIAIINARGQVLARRDAEFVLPEVDVEYYRAGLAISHAVREQLNLRIFCLVSPVEQERDLPLLRLQDEKSSLPEGLIWVDAVSLTGSLKPPVQELLEHAEEIGGYAWYPKATAWIEQQVSRLGYAFEGLEQWNGRLGGVLLRIQTSGPDLWFKSVSAFNLREFHIAQLLAVRHPGLFPRVLGIDTAWNALLLEHIPGNDLDECHDLDAWKATAAALADIQMDWMGSADRLLRAGAADLRAETIASRIPEFLDHVEAAMGRQPKTPPRVLTRGDCEELAETLYRLTDQVAALPLQPGLANADFSPHNVLITGAGPRFIDWAEACVSLPFIAGEYMWNRMIVESPERRPWQSILRHTYLRRWAKRFGFEAVERAAALVPDFAVLAVATFYHERESYGPSVYDAYLRSLARRLHRSLVTQKNVCVVQPV